MHQFLTNLLATLGISASDDALIIIALFIGLCVGLAVNKKELKPRSMRSNSMNVPSMMTN